jgi:hypothetical protein
MRCKNCNQRWWITGTVTHAFTEWQQRLQRVLAGKRDAAALVHERRQFQ